MTPSARIEILQRSGLFRMNSGLTQRPKPPLKCVTCRNLIHIKSCANKQAIFYSGGFNVAAFLSAVAFAILIAIGAMFVLDREQYSSDEAFTSPASVRLPSHGNTHNLVGKDWYSAKEHGWGAEGIPTSNSPSALTQ
jgi:hypothetical protein